MHVLFAMTLTVIFKVYGLKIASSTCFCLKHNDYYNILKNRIL